MTSLKVIGTLLLDAGMPHDAAALVEDVVTRLTDQRRQELAEAIGGGGRSLFQDGERYRWLRSRDTDTIERGGVFAGMTPKNVILTEDDLDRAIDVASAAEKHGLTLTGDTSEGGPC